MRQKSFFVTAFAVFLAVFSTASSAATDVAVCDIAASRAAQESGIPLSVLMSIARVESGQNTDGTVHPWPWTANVAGEGFFFESQADAIAFAQEEISAGRINFDVGCFQVNLKWHSKGFTSLQNAFDPDANAAYAARFLSDLFREKGNWSDAVAAYHSRTPEHASSYLEKVKSVWSDLRGQVPPPETPRPSLASPRVNNFPLLRAGLGANGSLVPQDSGPVTRFALR